MTLKTRYRLWKEKLLKFKKEEVAGQISFAERQRLIDMGILDKDLTFLDGRDIGIIQTTVP